MQITIYSTLMTFLWSSVLIILFSALRRSRRFLDVCSVSGIIILYLFCAVRMMMPIELPWAKVITSEIVYNAIYNTLTLHIVTLGSFEVVFYHLLVVVWIAVAIWLLIKMIHDYREVGRRLDELGNQTDDRIFDKLNTIRCTEKNPLKVDVVKSTKIDVPFGSGFLHKRIYIPDREYTDEELFYILKHEYVHFKNHDLWIKLLINSLCAIYWWNPFVYLLRRDLDGTFEIRCDQIVVKGMSDDELANYLQTLLMVFRDRKKNTASIKNGIGLLGVRAGNHQELQERFNILMEAASENYKTYGKVFAFLVAIAILVLSYSFIIQSRFRVPTQTIEDTQGAYSIEIDDSYIIHEADGRYLMHTSGGSDVEISEDEAIKAINAGFNIVERR